MANPVRDALLDDPEDGQPKHGAPVPRTGIVNRLELRIDPNPHIAESLA